MRSDLRFLFLEPFDGGSHGQFARGLIENCRFQVDLVSLPARFWKWRMRGAALHFARAVAEPQKYSGLIVSGLMSLADLMALWGSRCPPALVYFHETQLTYPRKADRERDDHFAFTDLTTALCARKVLFNSRSHRSRFFERLPEFLNRLPDVRPLWTVETVAAKSQVAMPGCDFPEDLPEPAPAKDPPLIIWNHRWEHDKNPQSFFRALDLLAASGRNFRLAFLGERFNKVPRVFIEGCRRFADRIICSAYQEDRRNYYRLLSRGHIVISTAVQENFGLAAVEAIRCGCMPLLPRRLVYPEIIPEKFHRHVFYDDDDALGRRLMETIQDLDRLYPTRRQLAGAMEAYRWTNRIGDFEAAFEELVASAAQVFD